VTSPTNESPVAVMSDTSGVSTPIVIPVKIAIPNV